ASSLAPSERAHGAHIASNEISVPSLSKTTRSMSARAGWSVMPTACRPCPACRAPGSLGRRRGAARANRVRQPWSAPLALGDGLLDRLLGAFSRGQREGRFRREGDGDPVADSCRRETRIVERIERDGGSFAEAD